VSAPRHPLDLIDRARVLELLSDHLASAWDSFDRPRPREPRLGSELRARLEAPLPEGPGDAEASLEDIVRVLDASVSPSRPLYTAYIGSTSLEAGVLAGALTNAYDVNLAASAGAAELLEQQALSWVGQFIGYPLQDGAFTSGGMTSNLTALVAAREHALPGARFTGIGGRLAAVYCSDEAHHSIARAVEVIGLGSDALRRIPIDAHRRLRADVLADILADDLRAGVTPVAVAATAGTTLTGAIDPLAEIADICARHDVWLHVDAAYGGPAAGVAELAPQFAGIGRADSVTVDAHKWLGVQKSCSVVMLAREGALERAFGHDERYMLSGVATHGVSRTLEYSRPVRSLKLWFAFQIYGAAMLRRWILETVTHAGTVARWVTAQPQFELVAEPSLSIVCFRHLGAGDLNEHNLRLAQALVQDGRVYLAPAVVDDKACLRVCFTNFRTDAADVEEMLRVVDEVAGTL